LPSTAAVGKKYKAVKGRGTYFLSIEKGEGAWLRQRNSSSKKNGFLLSKTLGRGRGLKRSYPLVSAGARMSTGRMHLRRNLKELAFIEKSCQQRNWS